MPPQLQLPDPRDFGGVPVQGTGRASGPGPVGTSRPQVPPPPTVPAGRSWMDEVLSFAKGVGSHANPLTMLQGLYQGVAHPWDTITGLAEAQVTQFSKAKKAFDAGNYSEALGHTMAGALPIVGPIAADIGEEMGSGKVPIAEGLGKTVGFAAMMAPKTTSAAVTVGADTVLGAAGSSRMGQAAATAMDTGAANRITQTIAPTKGPNATRFGNMAEEVAPRLASEPQMGAWTREGLHGKVSERLYAAEDAIDAAAAARTHGRAYQTKPIIDDLRARRRELVAQPVDASRPVPSLEGPGGRPVGGDSGRTRNVSTGRIQRALTPEGRPMGAEVVPEHSKARVGQIDKAIAELEKLGPMVHFDELKKIRASYDGPARQVYSPSMTADYLAKMGESRGAADVTSVLRERLAQADKGTAAANSEYAFWRKASDVLDATAEIERVRPTVGKKIMARLGGAVVGGHAGGVGGAALGAFIAPVIDGFMSSGLTTKVMAARALSDLAAALRGGEMASIESAIKRLRSISVATQATAKTAEK